MTNSFIKYQCKIYYEHRGKLRLIEKFEDVTLDEAKALLNVAKNNFKDKKVCYMLYRRL